ncbi:DUF4424 domain-containing protein [Rhizobium oryzicola]|uniref:DUF4424 domain-containing protein n=1 Tax=Rhizobium oryzicola TaxID=1232668 RepID=A0ABT8SSF1_9HYPH|nr:DUF4424 domain-containing protein [Rhizobium oryzicola]MDO1581251.1 DUF4424 domain-containing protein [Rhizobium oryzicola]
MIRQVGLGAAISLVLFASALANDTMAELKAGGLVFVRTSDVIMSQEELFLSMDEVRVDYVFTNKSDKNVETVVAFPMPDVEGSMGLNLALDDRESDNFLGFTVTQDGQAIKPTLDQHVLVAGVDRTDELRAAKVPLLPYSEKTYAALAALPDATKKDWISKGLFLEDIIDAGKGPQADYTPLWTLRSTYWWKTTFPAGKTVRVSHRYKPSVGGTVEISFVQDGKPNQYYKEYAARYCMDDAFLKTGIKLRNDQERTNVIYSERWLSYILKTGANWSNGAIGKFKLAVDKGRPENYVSFCGDGVKKTGPTTFVMEKTDFWPDKDLDLLFLVRETPGQDPQPKP